MKNILVTGGAGFIGSYTIKKLFEKGYNIITVDNFNSYYDPKLKRDRINKFLDDCNFKLYEVDIADYNNLREVFLENRIDLVVHQAAQAGVRYSLENPFVYQESNIMGTHNLLECCKDFDIKRFVFASSSSVYGERSDTPFKESDNTDFPVSLYAATKKMTETICYSYHKLYGIKMVGLRYFTCYGEWGRPDMALFSFTKSILEGRRIDVYGKGKMKRDFTHISDIVDGIVRAVEREFTFEIFNLGFGNPSGLMDFVDILERKMGKKAKKNFLPMQKGDVAVTYADIKRAKERLGWKPVVSLDVGVERFVEWYLDYYRR